MMWHAPGFVRRDQAPSSIESSWMQRRHQSAFSGGQVYLRDCVSCISICTLSAPLSCPRWCLFLAQNWRPDMAWYFDTWERQQQDITRYSGRGIVFDLKKEATTACIKELKLRSQPTMPHDAPLPCWFEDSSWTPVRFQTEETWGEDLAGLSKSAPGPSQASSQRESLHAPLERLMEARISSNCWQRQDISGYITISFQHLSVILQRVGAIVPAKLVGFLSVFVMFVFAAMLTFTPWPDRLGDPGQYQCCTCPTTCSVCASLKSAFRASAGAVALTLVFVLLAWMQMWQLRKRDDDLVAYQRHVWLLR